MNETEKVCVLGAGSWGCVLSNLLSEKGIEVRLWEFDPSEARRLSTERTLPGKVEDLRLREGIHVGSDLVPLVEGSTALVFVVPCRHFRESARCAKEALGQSPAPDVVVSCSKGLERETLSSMTQILSDELGCPFPSALSGPSHAEEVAVGLPTTVVAASKDADAAARVQSLFMTPRFRVYTSSDLIGVELGGALKNVLAIASGAATGLGFGDNTMAALATRGLAEMTRLGVAMGANPLTFAGLSGIGDLIVTCASRHSRNRRLGIELAKGASLEEALQKIGMVVEGVETARTVNALKERYGVEMPIATQIARTLFEGVPVKEAVHSLMLRDPKPEQEFGSRGEGR
jgi:glycerol-3-phosphate dehydrogenase (NAD(P)+)